MAGKPRPIPGTLPASNGVQIHRRANIISTKYRLSPSRLTNMPPNERNKWPMADAHAALQEQFAEMPQQREAATLGMWAFLATEVLFFGAMFLAYLVYRHLYP